MHGSGNGGRGVVDEIDMYRSYLLLSFTDSLKRVLLVTYRRWDFSTRPGRVFGLWWRGALGPKGSLLRMFALSAYRERKGVVSPPQRRRGNARG